MAADAGHFNRKVIIPSEGAKTKTMADAQAARELSARKQRKDAWEVRLDAWTFWTGHEIIPLATNTNVDVDIETVGGSATGRYMIVRLHRTLDAEGSASSSVALVHRDSLVI